MLKIEEFIKKIVDKVYNSNKKILTYSVIEKQDLYQEAFIKAYLLQDKLNNINNKEAYLYKSIKNHLIDYIRKNTKGKNSTERFDIDLKE